jgi:hypothetical protein
MCYLVGDGAVGKVDTAQIIEVSALFERRRLIRVLVEPSGFTGKIDEAVSGTELGGDLAGMEFCGILVTATPTTRALVTLLDLNA